MSKENFGHNQLNPSVSKFNRSHVHIFWFSFTKLWYIMLPIALKS